MSSNAVSKLYDWQKEIIEHKGNITIRGGRQTGKSYSVARRIYENAINYPGERTLIIAASERQENYIYEQVRMLIGKWYKGRSTLTKTRLKNDHEIYKFPVGQTGIYLEGLSNVSFLYADEAIHIFRKVWDSIMPMIAEPRKRGLGWITLLSTTRGKPTGFFYESFKRKDFKKIHVKAEDCPHISKEFLNSEKKRLGEVMYEIIYNGEFDERANKYFPHELIDKAIKYEFFDKKEITPESEFYLGIDPARYGKSKAAFVVGKVEKDKIKLLKQEQKEKTGLIDLWKITKQLNNTFKFRKIFIDDGGFGAGLIDTLAEDKNLKRKIRPINNRSAGKDFKILKEDLYSNVFSLLSQGRIDLVNDEELIKGLKDVQFEGPEGEEKILGTDISEAAARTCWAIKERYKKPKIISF